jgi:hypothetical protein
MVSQASNAAGQNWGNAQQFAEGEFKKLTITGQMILDGMGDGTISPDQGQMMLDHQKIISVSVIASVHLMNLVQAQAIINAAIAVLVSVLNTAIGAIKFV